MCEIPFVRVQLHILGECMFVGGVLLIEIEMCKLCVQERGASAAVRSSHSTQLTVTPTCYFSNDAEIVGVVSFVLASDPWGFYLVAVRRGFTLRGAERVTASQGSLVLAHRAQIRFSTEEKPAPFSRGSVFLKGRLNEKTERGREIERQHGKQTQQLAPGAA